MAEAVKAYRVDGKSVVYEYDNGSKEKWSGGTPAWRNRNPGNVIYASVNNWKGQIGFAGRFCCFSDVAYGVRAVKRLLVRYGKRGMTLEQGIATYAPAVENDTRAYVAQVEKGSGVIRDRLLAGLSERELDAVVEAIRVHEGYVEGTVESISKS